MKSGLEWVASSVLLSLPLLGCGSPSTPKAPPAPIEPVRVTHTFGGDAVELQLCDADCLASRRAACEQGGRSWRLDVAGVGELSAIHVSDAGLVRLELAGTVLHGVDSTAWLACRAECPGTSHRQVCFPYLFSVDINLGIPGCTPTSKPGPDWNGMRTMIVTYACEGYASAEVTVVPELKAVQDALSAVGVFEPGVGELGLPVLHGAGGSFEIRAVETSTCDAFDLPAGWELHATGADYQELLRVEPEIARNLKEREASYHEEVRRVAKEIMKEKLSAMCFSDGTVHPDAEIDACMSQRPEVRERAVELGKNANTELKPLVTARIGDEQTHFERNYDGPLCDHFASKR
jgi:hypothetical protein